MAESMDNRNVINKTLLKVADSIANNTKIMDLGLELGLTRAVVERCLDTNYRTHQITSDGTRSMLLDWGETQSSGDVMDALCNALMKVGLVSVVETCLPATYAPTPNKQPGRTSAMTPQLKRLQGKLKSFYKRNLSQVRSSPLHPESRRRMEEIYTSLILQHGRKKETCEDKPLSYDKLFEVLQTETEEGDCRRVVLLGEAGAGKTTLLDKIALDWATGKHLQEVDLLFLVPVRAIEKTEFFGDGVIRHIANARGIVGQEIDDHIEDETSNVMILLDALDESDLNLADSNPDVAGVGILRGEVFENTPVIVTSRPSHADQIYRNDSVHGIYTCIRVEGFTPEDVNQYIRAYFIGQASAGESLIAFIKDSETVRESMAPYPMFCAMLCHLWNTESRRKMVRKLKTFSQLFSVMLVSLQQQSISKAMASKDESEYAQIVARFRVMFKDVGRVALEGLLKKEFVFSKGAFISCMDAVDAACEMGILTKEKRLVTFEEMLAGELPVEEYRFPHKLFMEFMSSFYLDALFQSDPTEYHEIVRVKLLKESSYKAMHLYSHVFCFMVSHGGEQAKALLEALCDRSPRPEALHDVLVVASECLDGNALLPAVDKLKQQRSIRLSRSHNANQRQTVQGFMSVLEAYGHEHTEGDETNSASKLFDSKSQSSGSYSSCSSGAKTPLQGEPGKLEGVAAAAMGLCLLQGLEDLSLTFNLSDEFYSSVLSVSHLSKIKTIIISGVAMTSVMLHALLSFPSLQSLTMSAITLDESSGSTPSMPRASTNSALNELTLDVTTLPGLWELGLPSIRPGVKRLILHASLDEDITIRSADVEMACAALQNLNELSIEGYRPVRIDDHASLCRFVTTSCPGLTAIEFNLLVLGNMAVKTMVQLLVTHQSLRTIEFVWCATDGKDLELDELIRHTNEQGTLTVSVDHNPSALPST